MRCDPRFGSWASALRCYSRAAPSGSRTALSGTRPFRCGDVYKNRISVDQVAALQLKKHTRYPSLVLSTDGGVGYKSRTSTLSFDHAARPIPSEHRQRLIFERYFTPGGGVTTAER